VIVPVLPQPRRPLELWGGIECTVNRVANRYYDQLELSGHEKRASDIDLCAEFGLRVLRYPLLWERIAPGNLDEADWTWADERMQRMRDRGIDPIVGLMHHGSGPRHTSLLDTEFPSRFAAYARMVAERYPWIRRVTPINEPLTTARFSGLYGHWYPHGRSDETFARAFLNQSVAIRDAMRAMREVIPDLELVQTEDLGKVYSTPALSYQADFENERRWLTFDMLAGRVDPAHPMWGYLSAHPGNEALVGSLVDDPCPPSLIGVNYYATSERFLDERSFLYAPWFHGGNGTQSYADIEAVRARPEGIAGHASILCEASKRYQLPVAVSEAHLGCTREQQMRWLLEAWDGALSARARGCDVEAVTAWALFGSWGWESLVTRRPFSYECGAFDTRSRPPRPTALAHMIRSLAREGSFVHPAVEQPGWWRLDERLYHRLSERNEEAVPRPAHICRSSQRDRPILIIGASGTLGRAFASACAARGLKHLALGRRDLDITDAGTVSPVIRSLQPWAVINTAGYVKVDDAERERAACFQTNSVGAANLAGACAHLRIPFVTFSSDLVFDGERSSPYTEEDPVRPLNVYGASKVAAEAQTLRVYPDSLVIRTSAFFSPNDDFNFLISTLRALAEGVPITAAYNAIVSPTYVPDLANATLDLVTDGETGIWHLANTGQASWADFATEGARRAGLDAALVTPVSLHDIRRPARIPRYSALASNRGDLLPTLDDALDRFFAEANIALMRAEATC
jgi:dTDP-4-dehydrorhamnose reductase